MLEVKRTFQNDVGTVYELPDLQVKYVWIDTPQRPFITLQPMSGDYDHYADSGVVTWYGDEARAIRNKLEAELDS